MMYWQNRASPRSTLRLCSRLGGSSKGECSICDRVSGPSQGWIPALGGQNARLGADSGVEVDANWECLAVE